MFTEPEQVGAFREWLGLKGAYVHPGVVFVKDSSGMSVHAAEDIPGDTKVVSCPFSLAITPESSRCALSELSKLGNDPNTRLEELFEREIICTYLVMHWLLEEEECDGCNLKSAVALRFEHLPYLHTLPPADLLRTTLHFHEAEMSLLRGTNLHGATVDRKAEREMEWERCRKFVAAVRQEWEERFTWQRYLTAATYLSSRAFPSTLLSSTPSLISTESSHPVLLPCLDSLNHVRGSSVSWVVDSVSPGSSPSPRHPTSLSQEHISLVIHTSTASGKELFNNYGPKPNSELILGYGFSFPANPDDTIVLKVGGRPGGTEERRWEVGRDAIGATGLWEEIQNVFAGGEEESVADWEVELEAAEVLKEMVERKLMALPHVPDPEPRDVRKDVFRMIKHYIQGQEDVLRSLSTFADTRLQGALVMAKEEGVELMFEDAEGS